MNWNDLVIKSDLSESEVETNANTTENILKSMKYNDTGIPKEVEGLISKKKRGKVIQEDIDEEDQDSSMKNDEGKKLDWADRSIVSGYDDIINKMLVKVPTSEDKQDAQFITNSDSTESDVNADEILGEMIIKEGETFDPIKNRDDNKKEELNKRKIAQNVINCTLSKEANDFLMSNNNVACNIIDTVLRDSFIGPRNISVQSGKYDVAIAGEYNRRESTVIINIKMI